MIHKIQKISVEMQTYRTQCLYEVGKPLKPNQAGPKNNLRLDLINRNVFCFDLSIVNHNNSDAL